jgi:hypothetical protein
MDSLQTTAQEIIDLLTEKNIFNKSVDDSVIEDIYTEIIDILIDNQRDLSY